MHINILVAVGMSGKEKRKNKKTTKKIPRELRVRLVTSTDLIEKSLEEGHTFRRGNTGVKGNCG